MLRIAESFWKKVIQTKAGVNKRKLSHVVPSKVAIDIVVVVKIIKD